MTIICKEEKKNKNKKMGKKKKKGKETFEADSTRSIFLSDHERKNMLWSCFWMDVKAIQKPEHLETTHTVYGQKGQIKKTRDSGKK